jgi:hypothetical protein
MSKSPLPFRNYENLMLVAKGRLMFIEEFNDKKVDFLKVELIAVQLRKIIEGIAYGCVCACELGGESLSDAVTGSYDARNVFTELKRKNLDFVPRPCSFAFKGEVDIEEWNISNKGLTRSAIFRSANDYSRAYKKLHQYAHEFHPRRTHHLMTKDGLRRAVSFLGPIKSKITNSLWQHVMPIGNRALIVDFGARDSRPPETFVFRQRDGRPAWPILFAIAAPKS